MTQYLVTQEAKSPLMRACFAVFEARSKAEALRMFSEKGFEVQKHQIESQYYLRPTAQELRLEEQYYL